MNAILLGAKVFDLSRPHLRGLLTGWKTSCLGHRSALVKVGAQVYCVPLEKLRRVTKRNRRGEG